MSIVLPPASVLSGPGPALVVMLAPSSERFARGWRGYPSAALTLAISRDFRRAALFGWMTPFDAARSSALIAATTALLAASDEAP